jgi:EAL domain-containing protein (putative c-di-GMP-specific phosphodiesterase class I)
VTRIRVLIAEDEPGVREALAELVATEPSFEVVGAAGDAVEAMELARTLRPDVAVVDVKMPGGGGQRAAKGIRAASPQTRVLALSAYDHRTYVLEMLEAGAVGYVVKGTPAAQILEAIRASALGQGTLSAEVTANVIQELAGQLKRKELEDERRRDRTRQVRRVLGGRGLQIVYQPIADLATARVVGLEALSRFDVPEWRSPEASFRDAEAVGLLAELELAAIRNAFARLARVSVDVFVSINLSPLTATTPEFLSLLRSCPGSRVVMEITEHAEVDDYTALREALAEARDLGVRLAVDDAGAGFASLKHIVRLAPDFIKLDIALTRDIHQDPVRRSLATALITFAEEIGASIIAEGIETRGEFETLRSLGVPFGQGFFLAHPAPLADIGPATPPVLPIPAVAGAVG